jgi:hypothetical protein
MCLKKLFPSWFKPDVIPIPIPEPEPGTNKKIALLFDIGGGYPGTQNDLTGPPYDLKHVREFLSSKYPEFAVNYLSDSDVTRNSFASTVKKYIALLIPGDVLLIYYSGHGTNGYDPNESDGRREGIYLTDGPYWDDEFALLLQSIPIGAKVIIVLDSCFARGSSSDKIFTGNVSKFVQTQTIPAHIRKTKKMLKSVDMNYVIFAACGENQTSADLGTDGGAFTIYWLKAWNREFTYLQWSNQTSKLTLTDTSLDQVPNIDGSMGLMNEVIFS